VRVDERPAGQRLGDRVHREVAQREVGLDGAAAQRRQVDLPCAVGADHPPGAVGVPEREPRPADLQGEVPRGAAHVAVHDEVQVIHRPAHEPVADRPAHDPRALPAQRLAGGLERDAHAGAASRRSTRAVRPHVTS
jgi:hypothetical protein